jgi:hypothetical protein
MANVVLSSSTPLRWCGRGWIKVLFWHSALIAPRGLLRISLTPLSLAPLPRSQESASFFETSAPHSYITCFFHITPPCAFSTFLPEGGMRILRLLPSSNQESNIECQLITSMLDSETAHPDEALSHVGGSRTTRSLSALTATSCALPHLPFS